MSDIVDRLNDSLSAGYSELRKEAAAEITRLRAKIAEMEKQEPAGYGVRYVEPTNGEEDWDSIWKYRVFAEDHIKDFTQAYADVGEPVCAITAVPLYTLPGAQPAPSFADAYQGAMEEVERLRAKVEAMEKQEPVAFRWELKAGQYTYVDKPEHASKNARIVPLYLAPGAQGE